MATNDEELPAIPDLPPLPDITDTSYMSAPFQAPPRNPILPDEEEWQASTSAPQQVPLPPDNPAGVPDASTPVVEKSEASSPASRLDEAYAAAEARFMTTYRNPLEEEIRWPAVRVKIPLIWWVFLAVFFLAALSLFVTYLTNAEVFSVHGNAAPPVVLIWATIAFTVIGVIITFAMIRKPPFWSLLHLVLGFTAVFWGFGGVTLLTYGIAGTWHLNSVDATSKAECVSNLVPLALWGGFVLIVPIILVQYFLPPWERRAAVLRLGTADTFWGAYCGITLTMVLPHTHGMANAQFIGAMLLATFPVGGVFALGVAISLPVRWPISRHGYFQHILGVFVTALALAVLLAFVEVPDVKPSGRLVLIVLTLIFSVLGALALALSTRAEDPLPARDMEGLQDWVDADIVHAAEREFLCDEAAIHAWASMALKRGVYLAARDYYRAASELAFTSTNSDRGAELAEVLRITRRKLESAGAPPRPDFESFSEKPIFRDVLGDE